MDERVTTLESMMTKAGSLMASVGPEDAQRPTPCGEFTLDQLTEHVAVWVQVFDAAVNDKPLAFDPMTHVVGPEWLDVFGASAVSIVEGLQSNGFDRMMTMTASPLPGEFVLNMLLMEYVGHGWDIAKATGADLPFSEQEAETALAAAKAIIEPQYRGTGMFDAEVVIEAGAPAIDRFIGFLGRDPHWSVPT